MLQSPPRRAARRGLPRPDEAAGGSPGATKVSTTRAPNVPSVASPPTCLSISTSVHIGG